MKFTKQVVALALAVVGSVSAQGTILDVVVASDAHSTLEAAVTAAPPQIGELLASETMDGLTLFAPDDDAFAALSNGTVALLTSLPWTAHLVCVLTGTHQSRFLFQQVPAPPTVSHSPYTYCLFCFCNESPQVTCTTLRSALATLLDRSPCLRCWKDTC